MSRPGNSITVSRSKRGTTVKATGAAAQAVFDALAAGVDARLAMTDRRPCTVHFEDHGQDFLQWDVDAKGVVTDSRPFQAHVWRGTLVVMPPTVGQKLRVVTPQQKRQVNLLYPVTKVVHHFAESP